jgi:hypothetical protein
VFQVTLKSSSGTPSAPGQVLNDYTDPPPPNRRTAVVVMAVFTVLAVVAAVFGGGLLSRTATTSDGDFAGETVEVVIPLAEGGGTDTWAGSWARARPARFPASRVSRRSTTPVVRASPAPTASS